MMTPFLNDKPRVNIQDNKSVDEWCQKLGCTKEELQFCVSKVGSSISSIQNYLEMNRNLLEKWLKQN